MSNVTQIHPLAGKERTGFIGRFAMRSIFLTQAAPRDWIDDFLIPRGKATIFGLDHGQGKTTALLSAIVVASATGVWSLFGNRDHKRPLKCVLVTAEETEEDVIQKLAYDRPASDHLRMAKEAMSKGNLIIICLDKVMEASQTGERIFGDDGAPTQGIGRELLNELVLMKPDVIIFDTMRSCGSGDYNSDLVSSQTLSALNLLARLAEAAVIMTVHVTKDSAKVKLTDQSSPSALIGMIRGSGQIVSQARHVIVLHRTDDLFKGVTGLEKGDTLYVCGVKSNLGFPLTQELFPVVRSHKHLTFMARYDGKSLLDSSKSEEKWRYMRVLKILPKLIFAAAISGKPFSLTGAFSPEKLAESTIKNFLPEGATPAMVNSALKTLLAGHQVLQVKTTAGGVPNRYDVVEGPYATADREGAEPPASKGAVDTDLLHFAASDEAVVYQDILDYAVRRGTLAEGVEDLCRIEAGDQRIPEIQSEDDERAMDEVPGMDQMPDEWEQREDGTDIELQFGEPGADHPKFSLGEAPDFDV
ncbi:hypothetical protein PARHAE_03244 [Paracoccus haematequi]|uniref:Uncharacterized protein n=1 Tax=Paracoccus haematequi TaxID=2491866 RepID=A0A3S4DDM7_9RHOB|nr:AAA family ATPase [Paracoccus haematequi]VDS10033.1 hypothetical protein PARHAE_03244 [Paracoccus haematequi]